MIYDSSKAIDKVRGATTRRIAMPDRGVGQKRSDIALGQAGYVLSQNTQEHPQLRGVIRGLLLRSILGIHR